MPVFTVLFLAPVYVPLALLEGWIAAVAAVNPITPVLEAGRSLLAGEPEEVALAFLVALSLVVALGFWAIRGLRRAEAAG
jgi:ABC-2 type transport system permease protein